MKMQKNKTLAAILSLGSLLWVSSLTVTAEPIPSSMKSHQSFIKQNQSTPQAKPNRVSASDREFVTQTAQSNIAEIQLGKLAADRATSSEVQQFGQMMIQHHTQATKELQQLATNKGISLPSTMGEEHQAVMARLSKLSGAEFDQAYMNYMVQEHEKDISLFENQAQQGEDPDLKAWAAKTLPKLQEHQQIARSLTGNARGTTNR